MMQTERSACFPPHSKCLVSSSYCGMESVFPSLRTLFAASALERQLGAPGAFENVSRGDVSPLEVGGRGCLSPFPPSVPSYQPH